MFYFTNGFVWMFLETMGKKENSQKNCFVGQEELDSLEKNNITSTDGSWYYSYLMMNKIILCRNNQADWETKSTTQNHDMKSIEFLRQSYHIFWSAERIQRIKTQKSQRLKKWFCRIVQCAIVKVKNQNLSKNKRQTDCWVN